MIACTFSTFLAVMTRHNVDLLARLRFILMDGTAAGRLAAEKARPADRTHYPATVLGQI